LEPEVVEITVCFDRLFRSVEVSSSLVDQSL
jgi:hypothetical protein